MVLTAILVIAILAIMFGDEKQKAAGWKWLLFVGFFWVILQLIALLMYMSLTSQYRAIPDPMNCPSGSYTLDLVTGEWVCEGQQPLSSTPTPWVFTNHSDALLQLNSADAQVGTDSHIKISCVGDERRWRSTIAEFTAELYKDSIFGVPAELFCPDGGSFELDN